MPTPVLLEEDELEWLIEQCRHHADMSFRGRLLHRLKEARKISRLLYRLEGAHQVSCLL